MQGQKKTQHEIRQQLYENIIDEAMLIARASDGAVSLEWVMNQPIAIRKKYAKDFTEELKERKEKLKHK